MSFPGLKANCDELKFEPRLIYSTNFGLNFESTIRIASKQNHAEN